MLKTISSIPYDTYMIDKRNKELSRKLNRLSLRDSALFFQYKHADDIMILLMATATLLKVQPLNQRVVWIKCCILFNSLSCFPHQLTLLPIFECQPKTPPNSLWISLLHCKNKLVRTGVLSNYKWKTVQISPIFFPDFFLFFLGALAKI